MVMIRINRIVDNNRANFSGLWQMSRVPHVGESISFAGESLLVTAVTHNCFSSDTDSGSIRFHATIEVV